MNQVEYTAVISMINSVKSQLQGLETLVATIANVSREQKKPTRVARKNDDYTDSLSLSADEEELLEKAMKEAQEQKLREMELAAKENYEKFMQGIADDELKPQGE